MQHPQGVLVGHMVGMGPACDMQRSRPGMDTFGDDLLRGGGNKGQHWGLVGLAFLGRAGIENCRCPPKRASEGPPGRLAKQNALCIFMFQSHARLHPVCRPAGSMLQHRGAWCCVRT